MAQHADLRDGDEVEVIARVEADRGAGRGYRDDERLAFSRDRVDVFVVAG